MSAAQHAATGRRHPIVVRAACGGRLAASPTGGGHEAFEDRTWPCHQRRPHGPLRSRHLHPRANAQIALSSAQRAEIAAKLDSSKNCRYFETQVEARDVLGLKVDSKDIDDAIQCHREQDALRDGGERRAYFSLPRYLAINAGIALASALAVLGLAMTVPALLRRNR